MIPEKEIKKIQNLIHQPLFPLANNFTPRERTPWGGTKIAGKYKAWMNLPADLIVGESWEISGHPSFPSRFVLGGKENKIEVTLPELLKICPAEMLGEKIARKFNNQIPLLIKLLDAAENLSVQVHPNDNYKNLKPGETGKTEAWYIVDAEPGSGLYLGLQPGVSPIQLRAAIQAEADISSFLYFVPVKPGDTYFIPAGTIHAIGQGVTLIEPQQTSETTYRFWDWNRRYDASGKPSPAGQPRPLHLDDSFAVTNFNAARGARFIKQIKGEPELIFEDEENVNYLLLSTPFLAIEKIVLSNPNPFFTLKEDLFHSLTVIKGTVTLESFIKNHKISVNVPTGQSVFIPAAVSQYQLQPAAGDAAEIIKIYYPMDF